MMIFIKALTREEYDSLPEVVKYFSPPFDVLCVDHYEEHKEKEYRYTIEELLKIFS